MAEQADSNQRGANKSAFAIPSIEKALLSPTITKSCATSPVVFVHSRPGTALSHTCHTEDTGKVLTPVDHFSLLSDGSMWWEEDAGEKVVESRCPVQ